jgi:hypothetical protein
MLRTTLGAIAAACALAAVLAPAASADKAFHTLHADLRPVGASPLKSGFVNDIHQNGVVNGAREIYHLNGASPRTTYQVAIQLYLFDPTCAGAPLTIPTSQLTTNGAGNGNADFTFPAGPPSPLAGQLHGIRWTITGTDGTAYDTACAVLTLD